MWPFNSSQNDQTHQHAPTSAARPPSSSSLAPLLEERPPTPLQTEANPTQLSELADEPSFQYSGYPNERLGMPLVIRAPFLAGTSFITGFGLGVTKGGRRRADRFRAENSHRFPTTQAGWYLYHRSKSYNTIVGGVSEGVRFGGQLAIFATVFMAVEEIMDRSRGRMFARGEEEYAKGQRDAANTVVAGMSTAGVYILWKRMDVFAAGKMSRMALKYSLAFGLAQDAMQSLKGERPGYVQWALGKLSGRREDDGIV